jgi:hypothetical protein
VQRVQRWAGLDPELLLQRGAQLPVCRQRVGLTTGPVQRKHAFGVQLLPQRVVGHEAIQLGDRRAVMAQRQLRLKPRLQS